MYIKRIASNCTTILKLITGFDLPICRNALVFNHTYAFHLREFVLTKLYGWDNIAKSEVSRTFIEKWDKDERCETDRILKKIQEFGVMFIAPPKRAEMYLIDRENMFKDGKELNLFLKNHRKIVLIRFPFDNTPNFDASNERVAIPERVEKYQQRICENVSIDYHGNKTLPLTVYPLKYLAYWKLMTLNGNHSMYNCLCNFDFLQRSGNNMDLSENNVDHDNEPKPSTSKTI